MKRLFYSEMRETLERLFRRQEMSEQKARTCAETITESTFDGVHSHGINKVPSFIDRLKRGTVAVHAEPQKIASLGVVEKWDGHRGIGIHNARICVARAIEIAVQNGVGCVALRNTNHWFRAGSYGWQAIRAACALMGWTNTTPNMPAWGALEKSVGNNPLVVAVPHPETPVVLDMAMSQFAGGKLQMHRKSGVPLPVPGGYGTDGQPSRDAADILATGRALPIGFWKGSGLALVLDLLAALLSGGLSTTELGGLNEEYNVSQVFIAFSTTQDHGANFAEQLVAQSLAAFHEATPVQTGGQIYHPGQQSLERRAQNRKSGVAVDPQIWQKVLGLLE